ncbi:unnamed protein product [Cylicocyclus nassatus]|uniref:SCP domain-containing protein n=1 Tax=Cylicocyclus nassatus TaxID=53992 RepID=A0AA36ME15_CYLNA|nr:unnamed protein product [Cylicocyclus nassatus]
MILEALQRPSKLAAYKKESNEPIMKMLWPKYLAISIIFILFGLNVSEADQSSDEGVAYCKNGITSNLEVRSSIIAKINDYRQRVAAGEQKNGWTAWSGQPGDVPSDNLYLPPAKNMKKVSYDCSLEKEASRILTKMECSKDISEQQEPTRGFVFGSRDDLHDIPFGYLGAHLHKIYWHRLTRVAPVTYTKNDEGLKIYANMMRDTASRIGCANRTCYESSSGENIYMRLCITDQNKLEIGDQIYEMGTKGSCECESPLTCENSLCVEAIFPGSNSSESTWCASSEINDTIRMYMQNTHNYRRALLALGEVRNKQGKKLRAATNMNHLTWDCALEREAHDFLRSCPTEGYERSDDKSPAQNFYRGTITANEPTYRDMNKKTVTEWWEQVQKVTGLDRNAYFRSKHRSSDIKSYTLMGWASSEKMGCSIAKCGKDWVEACRYYPPGNQVNAQMYIPGKTCSKCKPWNRIIRCGLGLCLSKK